MSKRYFRTKKDNFMWYKGAILSCGSDGHVMPLDFVTLWDVTENQNEYISLRIIENTPEWFEEVWPVNLLTKTVYKAKEEAREYFSKQYEDKA